MDMYWFVTLQRHGAIPEPIQIIYRIEFHLWPNILVQLGVESEEPRVQYRLGYKSRCRRNSSVAVTLLQVMNVVQDRMECSAAEERDECANIDGQVHARRRSGCIDANAVVAIFGPYCVKKE